MTLQIGDTAPDFEIETTEGTVSFHEWIGDSWAVLFSHPRDFTPVCTTELGTLARIKPEFDRRGVKLIGLSVDPLDNHEKWAADIAETQGVAPNYPLIGDSDFVVSKLYGILPAEVSGDPTQRTPAQNQTVRNVFVIGPDKKIKLATRLAEFGRSTAGGRSVGPPRPPTRRCGRGSAGIRCCRCRHTRHLLTGRARAARRAPARRDVAGEWGCFGGSAAVVEDLHSATRKVVVIVESRSGKVPPSPAPDHVTVQRTVAVTGNAVPGWAAEDDR